MYEKKNSPFHIFPYILAVVIMVGIIRAATAYTKNEPAKIIPSDLPVTLTEDLLSKTLQTDKASLLVYFYTDDCPYCNEAKPHIEEAVKNTETKLYTYDIKVEKYSEFDMDGVPLIIYYEHGKEKDRIQGVKTQKEYEDFFVKYHP